MEGRAVGVTCRRMVGQVYSVFCFGSEKILLESGSYGQDQRLGDENSKKAFFTG